MIMSISSIGSRMHMYVQVQDHTSIPVHMHTRTYAANTHKFII
jgi:hypothetical protein